MARGNVLLKFNTKDLTSKQLRKLKWRVFFANLKVRFHNLIIKIKLKLKKLFWNK